MSIFGNLFKKKPSLEMQDPVFGPLTYEQAVWAFVPKGPGDGFMITIAAPETGPTAEQRAFFQVVRSGLSEFEQRARDFMRSRVERSVDPSRLSVYSVEIGSDEETKRQEFVLELSDSEAIVIHRVSFRAGEPVDYGFDD